MSDRLDDLFRAAGLPSKYEDETSAQLQAQVESYIDTKIIEARIEEGAYALHATAHMSRKDAHQFILHRIEEWQEALNHRKDD